jgi:hypothetical protein
VGVGGDAVDWELCSLVDRAVALDSVLSVAVGWADV